MIRNKEEFLEIVKKFHKSQTGEYCDIPLLCDMKCRNCIFLQGNRCNRSTLDKIENSKKEIADLEMRRQEIDEKIKCHESIIASCDKTMARVDEWNKQNKEKATNSEYLEKIADKNPTIVGIGVDSIKDENRNLEAYKGRVFIEFNTYKDAIKWLNEKYEE